jgi:hypothetical protein
MRKAPAQHLSSDHFSPRRMSNIKPAFNPCVYSLPAPSPSPAYPMHPPTLQAASSNTTHPTQPSAPKR